eukprot:3103761-Pyramimonas_sp.AAC.1
MLERIRHIDRTLYEKPTRHPAAAISGHMADLAARLQRRRDPSHIRTEYVTVTLASHSCHVSMPLRTAAALFLTY